jgi:branched-chain amino acid transport system permease protein
MMRTNAAIVLRAGVVAALVVLLVVVPLGLRRYGIYVMSLWAVMTIAAMGLNLTLGYAGQVSLAQGAFVGIGAYTVAIMMSNGMPFIVPLVAAVALSFAIGWLLGYPALRVQHHYLAFVTLAFSTLIYLVFRNEEWLTKGIYGIMTFKRPEIFGFSTSDPLAFYYFCLGMLCLATAFMGWIIWSPWGRAFVALRENPVRALSLGVDTGRYTLMAFAIGSAMGGFAGTLYAPLVEFVDPTPFTLTLSFNILMMVIVGGAGFFFAPFLGAAIAVLLPEWLRFAQGWYLVIYAAFVMALMIYSPTGLLGIAERWMSKWKARTGEAAARAAAPALNTAAPGLEQP